MGLRVDFDIDAIVAKMRAVGKDASQAGYTAVKQGSIVMRNAAREYSPVDEGDLEKAIITDNIPSEKTVYLGINQNATDNKGTSIEKYGMIMHEGLFPYGTGGAGYVGNPTVNPPTKSTIKDAGRGLVGGKFLERAYRENVKQIIERAGFLVKRVLKT